MSCVICRVVRVAALLQACLARTCFRAPASVDGWYGIQWREYPFVGTGSYFDSISFTAMTCTMGVYVNWIEYPNSGWDSPKDEHGASPGCSGQVSPNQNSTITCGKTGLHYTVHPAVWGECSRAEICDVQGVSHLQLITGTQVDYDWSPGEWTTCSETCGPGTKTRSVSCSPDPGYCNQNDKPSTTDDCNLASCQWEIQRWGACSHLCGGGERNRVVTCPRDDSYCTESKPATTEACNEQNCSATTEAFAGEADDPSSATWLVSCVALICSVQAVCGFQLTCDDDAVFGCSSQVACVFLSFLLSPSLRCELLSTHRVYNRSSAESVNACQCGFDLCCVLGGIWRSFMSNRSNMA